MLLALAGLWWRLDTLAERAIERGASEQLGVATEIRSLLLRPISGILALRGLEIANPPGYADAFLRVERARGELDVATLRDPVIVVREIALDGVEVTLEETAAGSNYDAIVANLDRGAGPDVAPSVPSVRVRVLSVRNVTPHLRVAKSPPLRVEIPEIRLSELGGPDGAGTGVITAEVVRAILTAVATEVRGVLVALAGNLLGRLGLSGPARRLRDAGERGLDAARDTLRGILD